MVLDHRLDGEDLAWVRDHLRRCDDCRQRVEAFRERRLRGHGPTALLLAVPPHGLGLLASVRRRAPGLLERVPHSRRYALIALMAALVAGLFVSSSPRFAADAVKPSPTAATLLNTGSVQVTQPSTLPSPSPAPEPSASPAPSQAVAAPTVIVPSSRPAPTHAPATTSAPTPDQGPKVVLTVTPMSGLAPLTVIADASHSSAVNAIASYEFTFAPGIVIRPVRGAASASYIYCPVGLAPGSVTTYVVTVVVTDTRGLQSSASMRVDVTMPVGPSPC